MTVIEDELKRFYARTAVPIDASRKRQVVEMVAREAQKTCGVEALDGVSFRRFVLMQMRFISPACWVFQIALIACVLIVGDMYRASAIQSALIMTFAVLTVAIAVPSVFRSLESKTSELELSCRFNCAQVLASRLIIFGLADVLWFSLIIAVMPSFAKSDPFSIFLYATTPFFLFCSLCFYLARVMNEHVVKATIAAAVIILIVLWQLIGLLPYWYSELSWATWIGALAFAVALAAFELHRLIGDMSFVVGPSFAHDIR